MQDLGSLMKDKQKLWEYATELEGKLGGDVEVSPHKPQLSRIRFGAKNPGRPNLMDAYAKHTARDAQSRGGDGSLTQLRDWKRHGADDLSLIELLVARDPESNRPGHDYQQLALDRRRRANDRLALAERY